MCGNGPRAHMLPIPASSHRQARWENTMGSSCATSMCCAEAPVPHPSRIYDPPIAISSQLMRNGNLWEFVWQGRCNIAHSRKNVLWLSDFEPQRDTFRNEVLQ